MTEVPCAGDDVEVRLDEFTATWGDLHPNVVRERVPAATVERD